MRQIIIDFGLVDIGGSTLPIRIYGYGLMLVLGFALGIVLARRRARRFGESPEVATNIGLIALVGGIVGARLAFVIERWPTEFAHRPQPLVEMLNVTSGGLIYHGGLLLATLLVVAYLRLRRLSIRRYLDIVAPSMMIGLGFGRLGCLLNGCCFGGVCPADFPLAMRFPYASAPLAVVGSAGNPLGGSSVSPAYSQHVAKGLLTPPDWLVARDAQGRPRSEPREGPRLRLPSDLTVAEAGQARHERSLPVQPSQALSATGAFLLAGLLLAFSRLRRREGQVFAVLVTAYPVFRFFEESLRGDNPHDLFRGVLTHSQYEAIAMVAVGLVLLLACRKLPAVAGPYWKERQAAKAPPPASTGNRRKGKKS